MISNRWPRRRDYEAESTVRTLTRCDLKQSGPLLTFIIEGDGFLYKMCRGIAGTLVQVGQGKIAAGEIRRILAGKDRRLAGMTAPAHGLVLWRVFYGKKAKGRGMNIVLVEPEIPPNTGNVARLCAATKTRLHLIEPLGFTLDDKQLKRAGMDYWQQVEWHRWPDWTAFTGKLPPEARLWFVESDGPKLYSEARFAPDDYLVFGRETAGLPKQLLEAESRTLAAAADVQRGITFAESVQLRGDCFVRGVAAAGV